MHCSGQDSSLGGYSGTDILFNSWLCKPIEFHFHHLHPSCQEGEKHGRAYIGEFEWARSGILISIKGNLISRPNLIAKEAGKCTQTACPRCWWIASRLCHGYFHSRLLYPAKLYPDHVCGWQKDISKHTKSKKYIFQRPFVRKLLENVLHPKEKLNQNRRQHGIQNTGKNNCIDLKSLQSILQQKFEALQEISLREKRRMELIDYSVTE